MTLEDIITPKLLLNLDKLMLNIKTNSSSPMLGKRKSSQKGSSLDFSDYRAYSQGDDIRKIDWNSYARSGKTNIKLYNEEKQSNINIIMDCSKSMDCGSGLENKMMFAKLMAALLAYVYIKNDDNVNIYTINEVLKLNPVSINNASKAGFHSVVKQIDGVEAIDGYVYDNGYKFNILKNGGLTFVISDFYSDYEEIASSLQELGQRVVFIHTYADEEINIRLDADGYYTLIDSETKSEKKVLLKPEIISAIKELVIIYKKEIKEYSMKRNIIYFYFLTDINILDSVFEILSRE